MLRRWLLLRNIERSASGDALSQKRPRRRSPTPADHGREQESSMSVRSVRRGFRAVFVLAALLAFGDAEALITVGPASDSACNYHDLQSAVNAAAMAGPELIQVSTGTYPVPAPITVADSNTLTIEGGYPNCSSSNRTDRSTFDGGGFSAGPIFEVTGSGALTLIHLILENANNTSGPGGAIVAVVAGPLTLSDVLVASNRATFGGGLFVSGNDIVRSSLTLIDSSINSNTAANSGGGLYVTKADVTIEGSTDFLANIASGDGDTGDGGGIYALDANIHATAHSLPKFPFIGFNTAARNGGGVYFAATHDDLEFFLANDSASLPLVFQHNVADFGGGLYMTTTSATGTLSYADFWNVIFDDNIANEAQAIWLDANQAGTTAVTTVLRMERSKPGDAIPMCASSLDCNAIRNHQSPPADGDLVSVRGSGNGAVASFDLERGTMHDNTAGQLIFASRANVDIEGSLLASNNVASDLIAAPESFLHVANSTIANNGVGTSELIFSPLAGGFVELFNDIADAPGKSFETVGSGATLIARDIMLSFGTALGSGSGDNVQTGDPSFVDAANGDFHLQIFSEAIDRSAASSDPDDPPPTVDLDGGARPFTRNGSSTPYDFGAYEYGATVDVVFKNGFE
jgi:predicted outer membrane repeat protein